MLAVAMTTASVNAQNTAITANKAGDNLYVGANLGVYTPQQKFGDAGFLKGFAPKLGVRVGKNFTTVFGVAADADIYFLSKSDSKSMMGNKTLINSFNLSLLGTANLSNAFAGYKGEPRNFEVIALGGFGWGHQFGGADRANALTSKAALDFAFNLGADKAWQVYVEPALVYNLASWQGGKSTDAAFQYDSRKGGIQLSVGANYKFGTSNGTHNFAAVQLRDQAEIDGLNAQINGLRAENQKKDGRIAADGRTIADLQQKLTACQSQPKATSTTVVAPKEDYLITNVVFKQGYQAGKVLTPAGNETVALVAEYLKNNPNASLVIEGYASPEGDAAKNAKLAQDRADAVKAALINKYKIAESRLTAKGCGIDSSNPAMASFSRVARFKIVK